jgi:hypothetical protein
MKRVSGIDGIFIKSRISAVLHGHVHRRYDPVSIEGALFYAHPFGYPGEHADVEDGYRLFDISK